MKENELVIDINKDGTFGEKLVEVSKVLFSGLEGYEERGIYRASNNDLVASEPELEKGDVFNYETTIVDSNGDPFEPGDRVAGVRGARGGFSLIYQDGIKFYEQLFRESRDIARQNGKKRDVTKKIFKLEDELGIDLNKDGYYGDQVPVIQDVLFDGTQGFDWRGFIAYRMEPLLFPTRKWRRVIPQVIIHPLLMEMVIHLILLIGLQPSEIQIVDFHLFTRMVISI